MTDPKAHGPLKMLMHNAETCRTSVRLFRADADRLLTRAVGMEADADEWERAAAVLQKDHSQ